MYRYYFSTNDRVDKVMKFEMDDRPGKKQRMF